jgi:hypothetical protein
LRFSSAGVSAHSSVVRRWPLSLTPMPGQPDVGVERVVFEVEGDERVADRGRPEHHGACLLVGPCVLAPLLDLRAQDIRSLPAQARHDGPGSACMSSS